MEIMNMRELTDFGMEDPSFILNSLSSFQGMEDPSFILNSLDDYTFEEGLHHHSLSSHPIPDLKRSGDTCHAGYDRPTKVAKSYSWDSSMIDQLSNTQATFPKVVTFGNTNYPSHVKQETLPAHPLVSYENQNYVPKAYEEPKRTRTATCNQEHIIAERKRREKLSQKFIALSALVPGLKKMDKASVLGDATKYLKQLQEQVKTLEEQAKRKKIESAVFVKRHELYGDDDGSSSDKNCYGDSQDEPLLEIEARSCDGNVLIRIHCEKKRGIIEKTVTEIEKLHLSVLNSSVLSFGTSLLDITVIAQMDTGFTVSIKDLVEHMRNVFKLLK